MPQSQNADTTAIMIPQSADSLAVDSVAAPAVIARAWENAGRHEQDAPSSAAERAQCPSLSMSYMAGLAPQALPRNAATDSGVLTLLTVMFLLVAFNFKHCAKVIAKLGRDLLSTRRRANVFNDSTVNETRVLVVMLFQLWVGDGLLAYAANVSCGAEFHDIFRTVAAYTAVAAAFYLAQLGIYRFVGYLFTDKVGAVQWVKGYNSSQAFLGAALLIPALVTLFYPGLTKAMVAVAAALYVVARVVFIAKGFRIFYHKIASLLYFILYLCALELIPIIAGIVFCRFISGFL
jgi:hypothetical protein